MGLSGRSQQPQVLFPTLKTKSKQQQKADNETSNSRETSGLFPAPKVEGVGQDMGGVEAWSSAAVTLDKCEDCMTLLYFLISIIRL